MANGDDGMVVVVGLMQAVARAFGWKSLEPLVIDAVSLSRLQFDQVAASYGHGMVIVTADGDALRIAYQGSKVELVPLGGDRFVADPGGSSVSVKVERDPAGSVKSLSALGRTLSRNL
ncbi:hypothetical protein [Phenylobacterium sp.]|uniref:hypothetical protein n=1 Tax=Phenylobacterium sp. TaxID=1871053 RepID=UPI00286ADE76|nr:hypothetical protein [Phenylobacterium sp.]